MNKSINIVLLGKGLNQNGWRPIEEVLKQKGHQYKIIDDHRELNGSFDLGILLGYSKIVPLYLLNIPEKGFVLFHSSDLPEGRGWAPIYHTIVNKLDLVQTMLYASEEADRGNILAKATYKLKGFEMEHEVRKIDDELTLGLINECIDTVIEKNPVGKTQHVSSGSWWKRRKPEDSKIDPALTIEEAFDTLRALPSSAPAFFDMSGRKFQIKLEPVDKLDSSFDRSAMTIEKFF
jgi:methionyl-tRNA formyltransferase